MLELALHILDIAENSVRAGAKTVFIDIIEGRMKDRLLIEIRDDGSGMDEATVKRAMDPFYTSKKVRRVGLGLPMLAEAAERAGGSFAIDSREGMGTRVAVPHRSPAAGRSEGRTHDPDRRQCRRRFRLPA
jgi:signal transduction histidine kinase